MRRLRETDGLIRVTRNTLGKANEQGHADNEPWRLIGQVEYCPARMARLSDVTLMCHVIAMNELIGYGNRTLLNVSDEISFCQRTTNGGLTGGLAEGRAELDATACRSIRKVRIALPVRLRLKQREPLHGGSLGLPQFN
jgi:hypothetical protein